MNGIGRCLPDPRAGLNQLCCGARCRAAMAIDDTRELPKRRLIAAPKPLRRVGILRGNAPAKHSWQATQTFFKAPVAQRPRLFEMPRFNAHAREHNMSDKYRNHMYLHIKNASHRIDHAFAAYRLQPAIALVDYKAGCCSGGPSGGCILFVVIHISWRRFSAPAPEEACSNA